MKLRSSGELNRENRMLSSFDSGGVRNFVGDQYLIAYDPSGRLRGPLFVHDVQGRRH